MNTVNVKKAETKKEMNDFISLPRYIYKDCKEYVPDLDMDIRDMFDPKKNMSLENADVQPFVAYQNGKCVGRIVGIINHKSNKIWKKSSVRFSLIEFIDDINVSKALLEAVEHWGKGKGMNSISGPMGVTDFDKEGMLVEDFELGGTFLEYWNHPYYPKHMEQLGYEKEADWLQIRFQMPDKVPARYSRVAQYAKEEFGVHAVTCKKKDVNKDLGPRLFDLVNQAYAPLFGFSPFSKAQVKDFLKKYLPLLDIDLVAFIEDNKNDLVGMAVTIKDPSEGLKKTKGKLFPFGWFHLLKTFLFGKIEKLQLMIIAVRPDLQGMGINAVIFDHLIPICLKKGIKWCETGPQLETNTKELSQWKALKPQLVKRRRCWTKEI